MNLNFLTDQELIAHCCNYSDDPVVKRLINMLDRRQDAYQLLKSIGVEEDLTFDGCPLDVCIRSMRQEILDLNEEIYRLESEVHRLSTTTVVDFIAHVGKQLKETEDKYYLSTLENQRLERTLENTRDQLKAWNYLRQPI